MDWHDIASCQTTPTQGHLGFAINWRLPEAGSKIPPTQRQLEAVQHFYTVHFPDLTDDQCHKLLSCREFARLSADVCFPKYNGVAKEAISRCLAAFLLSDDHLVKFCTNWSDSNFRRGSASPRVKGAPIFPEMNTFADYVDGSMLINGWTPQVLTAANFSWPTERH